MTCFRLCGLKVTSAFPLMHLPEWSGSETVPGLEIRAGAVPPLAGARQVSPLLQLADDGCCRFSLPDVASYLVNPDATGVVIDTALPPDASDISAFFFSTVFAIICFKRGWLPLHAASVCVNGRGVLFCGPSGAGKSTLASRFIRKGIPVLADDVSVMDFSDPDRILLRPTLPHLKLWRDIMDQCNIPPDGLTPVRNKIQKYYVPQPNVGRTPVPLSGIYYIGDSRGQGEVCQPVTGVENFMAVRCGVYRRRLGEALLSKAGLFRLVSHVAGRVPGYRLLREKTLPRADALVAEILAQGR